MKRRASGMAEHVTFDMTPMIDCCFQLIIFFMLSMKVFAAEGDFSIKMPLAISQGEVDPTQLPPIKLRMQADGSGKLVSLVMGARPLSSSDPFGELRREVREMVKDDIGPGQGTKQEVELDCDPGLQYQYVIRAITAVSGYVDPDSRQIVKLVEKIKFSPRRPG